MDPLLPDGHPCTFARKHLNRPKVADAVRRYNALDAERRAKFGRGDYDGAWAAMVAMKELEQQLRGLCEAPGHRHGEPPPPPLS
jgi:hypothetical protein